MRDAEGRAWLDATSGVFVAGLGYDPPGVADAMAYQTRRLGFAYGGHFSNAAEDALAERLIDRAPRGMAKMWLTTSGAAANEAAVKLARQRHLLAGEAERSVVVARAESYHGGSFGTLSLTGHAPRRAAYLPYLRETPRAPAPTCARCPLALAFPSCDLACADAFDAAIDARGERFVSAVIVEAVAGAPLGALASPPGYLKRVREICDRRGVLMIVDEVVTGVGRTGEWFACAREGVTPDIITLGKGLGAGFAPIGAVLATAAVTEALDAARVGFAHSESLAGHPMVAAAGCAVIDAIERSDLLGRAAALAVGLDRALAELASHPLVMETRGVGLLRGATLTRPDGGGAFARGRQVAETVVARAREKGVLLLAGVAGAGGGEGDAIVLAPALTSSEAQIDAMTDALAEALDHVAATL